MNKKTRETTYKLLKDDAGQPTGEVEALVSAYGNIDHDGDRIMQGAFDGDLKTWRDSGDPIPMVWSHQWKDPMSHIGEWYADKSSETPDGLLLVGKVDIGIGNPVADQAYRLMKGRRIREFSVALDIKKERTAQDKARNLMELGLIEAGPCLKGANPDTELLAVKTEELAEDITPESPVWEMVRNFVMNELRKNLDMDSGAIFGELKSYVEMLVDDRFTTKASWDEGQWDGDAAMSSAARSPNPAAAFAKICAGKTESDPETRDGWRLPHHATADSPPNVQGVKAAIFREPQAPIMNHGAAEAHLKKHLADWESYEASQKKALEEKESEEIREKEEKEAAEAAEKQAAELKAQEDQTLRRLDDILIEDVLKDDEEQGDN